MSRYGLLIDYEFCFGCHACELACKQEHFLPAGVTFNRVLVGENGRFPSVIKEILPVQCNHCEEAVCADEAISFLLGDCFAACGDSQ